METSDDAGELVSRLCHSRGADLRKFLKKILKQTALAEEIAQEAYLKFYRLSRPGEVACPDALLFSIAANLAFSHLRRVQAEALAVKPIETPAEAEAVERVPDAQADLERRADSEQSLQWLTQIIDHLPANLREALQLHYFEQLSYREIGERLGITPKAAEKRVFRALLHSRGWLSARRLLWLGPL